MTGTWRIDLRMGAVVEGLEPLPGGGARLTLGDGEEITAEHVILAVSAYAAAELLASACPPAAAELRAIDYASVATIALSYPADAFPQPLKGSGFLVTAAASGCSRQAPGHRPSGPAHPRRVPSVLLKCSAGARRMTGSRSTSPHHG